MLEWTETGEHEAAAIRKALRTGKAEGDTKQTQPEPEGPGRAQQAPFSCAFFARWILC